MRIDKLELIGKIKEIIGDHGYVSDDQFCMDSEDFDHAAENIAELFRDYLCDQRDTDDQINVVYDNDYIYNDDDGSIKVRRDAFRPHVNNSIIINDNIALKFIEEDEEVINVYKIIDIADDFISCEYIGRM